MAKTIAAAGVDFTQSPAYVEAKDAAADLASITGEMRTGKAWRTDFDDASMRYRRAAPPLVEAVAEHTEVVRAETEEAVFEPAREMLRSVTRSVPDEAFDGLRLAGRPEQPGKNHEFEGEGQSGFGL